MARDTPEPACGAGAAANEKRPPHRGGLRTEAGADQFRGVFLPSLYVYRVMAGFFSSPLGSKAIWAVTPL